MEQKNRVKAKIWRYVVGELFKRENSSCQLCKKTDKETKLVVHHIDGENGKYQSSNYTEKNNKLDNLSLLCFKCHRQIHGLIKRDYPLDMRLTNYKNKIFIEIWNKWKSELSMKDLSSIFKTSLPQIYRILKKVAEKDNKSK